MSQTFTHTKMYGLSETIYGHSLMRITINPGSRFKLYPQMALIGRQKRSLRLDHWRQ